MQNGLDAEGRCINVKYILAGWLPCSLLFTKSVLKSLLTAFNRSKYKYLQHTEIH